MATVAFPSFSGWETFHKQICADLGIPHPGERQSDGKTQLDAQWTTAAYAPDVIEVLIDKVPTKVAIVRDIDDKTVARYKLTTIPDPTPVQKTDSLTVGFQVAYADTTITVDLAPDKTAYPFEEPLPATWIVDGVPTPVPVQAVAVDATLDAPVDPLQP